MTNVRGGTTASVKISSWKTWGKHTNAQYVPTNNLLTLPHFFSINLCLKLLLLQYMCCCYLWIYWTETMNKWCVPIMIAPFYSIRKIFIFPVGKFMIPAYFPVAIWRGDFFWCNISVWIHTNKFLCWRWHFCFSLHSYDMIPLIWVCIFIISLSHRNSFCLHDCLLSDIQVLCTW